MFWLNFLNVSSTVGMGWCFCFTVLGFRISATTPISSLFRTAKSRETQGTASITSNLFNLPILDDVLVHMKGYATWFVMLQYWFYIIASVIIASLTWMFFDFLKPKVPSGNLFIIVLTFLKSYDKLILYTCCTLLLLLFQVDIHLIYFVSPKLWRWVYCYLLILLKKMIPLRPLVF